MQFCLLIYFCLVASFINVGAAEFNNSSTFENSEVFSDCITVNFEQIHLTNDGMFVHIDREYIPIYALYSNGANQYTIHLDAHNRLHCLKTCQYCNKMYDCHRYKGCPNVNCPGMH